MPAGVAIEAFLTQISSCVGTFTIRVLLAGKVLGLSEGLGGVDPHEPIHALALHMGISKKQSGLFWESLQ